MILETIFEAILNGDARATAASVQTALQEGHPADVILGQACIPAMTEAGAQFETGEKFVPEMLLSARAMNAGMAILRPFLVEAGVKTAGKIVLGTAAGDLHDIGKNLVGMMLEGAGFDVIDLGTDVSPSRFVDAVRYLQPDILGMSALLTTTLRSMSFTIAALEQAGLRSRVKVMIGGAPVTEDYALRIGADGFAADAGSAARIARALLTS